MNKKTDWIEVKIAMDEGHHLAMAYNRSMMAAATEWVLFLDHDLFFCNPHWYQMALYATQNAPVDAGWITAVTNRIGNKAQRASFGDPEEDSLMPPPNTEDVSLHCKYAKMLYDHWGNKLIRCRGAMSGFFILTSKRAWQAAGGFDEGRKRLLGVDNRYSSSLSVAGFRHYKLPGLYFYHMYRHKKRFMRW